MADIDKAVGKIEQGNAWEESDKVVHVEVKESLDKVIPVRAPFGQVGADQGRGKGTGSWSRHACRMWILERLRQRVKALGAVQ